MAGKRFPEEFNHRDNIKKEDILLVNNSETDIDEYATIEEAFTLLDDKFNTKADKVSGATDGNFASLDANGNLEDSGKKSADFVEVVNIANNLTTEDEGKVLDARQGKALNDAKQDAITINADTTPVNTDEVLSLRGGSWLKTTWTNLKAFLKTYFDTLYEVTANKVTSLSSSSTDTQYPSAKLTYDQLALQEKIADLKLIQPAVQFHKRVIADGGTVVDKSLLAKFYTEMNQSLANTHALYFFQLGIKERVSGINRFCNKAYDLGPLNNDGVMATEATQPYVGGYIAPNEFRCLKYLQGQTQTGEITIPSKSYLATDSWALFLVLKANKRGTTRILTGTNSYIDITATTIVLHNGTSATLTGTHTYDVGKIAQIEFQYSNGTGLIKVNNVPLATTVISTTMSFTRLAYSSTNPFDGSIYYYHLENIRISEADSQKRYTFLRSLFAEIEGINIGNQNWITSNVEQTVAGNGEVIPEVQLATTAATEYLSGGDFEAGLIGTLVLDGSSATWAINETSPISGTKDGKLIIAALNPTRPYIQFVISPLTAGKVHKFTFAYKVNSGTVKIRALQVQGTFAQYDETISGTGVFTKTIIAGASGITAINFGGSGASEVQIDNISIKEAGWADLTTPAWCYPDNDVAKGAVYGKILNGFAINLLKLYAPQNYRVMLNGDFTQLRDYLGGSSVAAKRLKKDGIVYFSTPNTGTNDSGFSAIGGGKRNADGTFAGIGTSLYLYSGTEVSADNNGSFYLLNNSDAITYESIDKNAGYYLRYIRTSPVGENRRQIESGFFTTDIASVAKSINVPHGYVITQIRITTTTNVTSIEAKLFNTAGSAVATLITGKACNATSIVFDVAVDQPTQPTDFTVKTTAVGNSTAGVIGMNITVICEKIQI